MSDGPFGRKEFRAVVDAEIAPHAARFDREQSIPANVLRRIGELGWWGRSSRSRPVARAWTW